MNIKNTEGNNLSEFELIEYLAKRFSKIGESSGVLLGIGDDCAVLESGRFDLVTTDTLVEDVHFSLDYMSPNDIGYRTMVASLSDVAAMGGAPGPFFVNLSLPPSLHTTFVQEIYDGIEAAIQDCVPESVVVELAGGDMTRSPKLLVLTLTLLGESSPLGPVSRRGAVPGDRIIVTGMLGRSAAGLTLLRNAHSPYKNKLEGPVWDELSTAHRRPKAHVALGAEVGFAGIASAMIDCSDGFLQDLHHILLASGVSASCHLSRFPIPSALESYHFISKLPYDDWILAGGEDYELIIILRPSQVREFAKIAQSLNVSWYDVGEIQDVSPDRNIGDVELYDRNGEPCLHPMDHYKGFLHF